ncbi:Protein of unknown function (DUF3651) [Nesidiocoris tenuis]|uniref:Transmembrane protein 131-like N-terminal domain-containing protein n=1 Tax=Nesidiocoris tenuis TaxID=355587 RepID=A0ABN7AF75_9HEMI|nr:Protein of unknown function (DUF3651) [Nesidiocoris tenuis]
MSTKFTYCYASILVLLDLFDTSDLSSDANSFYSPNEDVRYLVDSIPVSLRQELAGGPDIDLHNLIDDRSVYSTRVHLKFFPPVLDFKQRDFGVPYHETVAVVNTSGNRSVHMSSISGNTVHFHSSFFQDKVIPPLSNTTFDVVFLGRGEGEIKSTLFIHTSEGSFKYHVRGESSYSPYRLRSLSGVRLPLNASYSPLIVMHNPHSTSIQLSEVYSSSGEFHLELPSGDLEGPRQIWSVPAFLTKPIIRLRFHASSQKNHTAYIRLKVDETGEILIIPIDIEVDVNGGLYAPDDLIDFGIGGTGDQPKVLKLYLKNSGKRAIKIQDVYSMPYSKSLNIDFQPVTVSPDHAVTEVATLAFDWKSAFESGETFGKIFVKCANSNQRVVLSYTATVLDGGLFYDSNQTKFQSDQYEIEPRTITMTNRYKVPVTIFNISLASEAAYYFQVVNFEPFIFHPGETRIVMVIEAIGGSLPLHLKLESEILVFSNVSTISIPILCYDGKLAKVLVSDPNDTELYFGTVGSGTLKMVNFALVNENPVAVQILDLSLNMTESTIYAAAVEKGNSTTASIAISSNDYNVTLSEPFIGPGYFCIVQVSVPAGPAPGNVYGEVKIETEFEVIRMPLFMRVEHGSLRVVTNPVEFNDCFPSAICMAEVRVESNFTVGMAVTGVSSIPFQPRLGFIPASPPLIPPLTTTLLGHVTWDMSGMESYLTPTTTSIGGHTWLDTLSIPRHVREWDISLLNFRYAQYSNISTELIELSLRLDTTELIFDSYYPLAKGIVDDLPTSLRPPVNSSIDGNEYRNTFQFVLEDEVKTRGESDPDKNSLVMYLKPFSNVSVSIAFKPERAEYSSSILLIRNNLTILEAVHLYGSGAYAHFKFGNRKPGSSLPLLFEVAEKHLKDCDSKMIFRDPHY